MQIAKVVTDAKHLQEPNKSEQHVTSGSKRYFLLGKYQLQTSVLSPTIPSNDVVVSFSLSKAVTVCATGNDSTLSFRNTPHSFIITYPIIQHHTVWNTDITILSFKIDIHEVTIKNVQKRIGFPNDRSYNRDRKLKFTLLTLSDTFNCKNAAGNLLNSPSITGTIKVMLRLKLLIQVNLTQRGETPRSLTVIYDEAWAQRTWKLVFRQVSAHIHEFFFNDDKCVFCLCMSTPTVLGSVCSEAHPKGTTQKFSLRWMNKM
jgi:hypothetical protein